MVGFGPGGGWLKKVRLHFGDIFGTGIAASVEPLYLPGTVFVVVSLATYFLHRIRPRSYRRAWRVSFRTCIAASTALVFTVPMVQVFIASQGGAAGFQRMPVTLAEGVAALVGGAWPLFATFIGGLGAFVAGSNTVSNMMFSLFQFTVGERIGVDPDVDAVSLMGSEIVVQTSPASLSDAVASGSVSSRIRLLDLAAAAARTSRSFGGSPVRSEIGAGGLRRLRMTWPDRLLVAEEEVRVGRWNGGRLERGARPGPRRIVLRQTPAEWKSPAPIVIDVNVGFEPELKTELKWGFDLFGGVTLHNAEIIVSGEFMAEIGASYNFAQEATWEQEIPFPIFTRSYTQVYLAPGAIPVYQEVTFTLKAQVTAQASAAIEAASRASVRMMAEFGAWYNPNTGAWQKIASTTVDEPSFTADLSVHGGVQMEVRLIPEIVVEFYKVVSTTLSVEPYTTGNIAVESIAHADILEGEYQTLTQLSAFDFNFDVECFPSLSLDILVKTVPILDKTKVCGGDLPWWGLFSLPQLWSSHSVPEPIDLAVGQSITFSAQSADGINNPLSQESVKWIFDPESALVELDPEGPNTLRLTPQELGVHTVIVSGHGALGELGRRFYAREFDVRHGYFAGHLTAAGTGISGNCRLVNTREWDLWIHLSPASGLVDFSGYTRYQRTKIDAEGKQCNTQTVNDSGSWGLTPEAGVYQTTFGAVPPVLSVELVNGEARGTYTADWAGTVISGTFVLPQAAPP